MRLRGHMAWTLDPSQKQPKQLNAVKAGMTSLDGESRVLFRGRVDVVLSSDAVTFPIELLLEQGPGFGGTLNSTKT